MSFLLSYITKQKVRIFSGCNSLDSLTMATAICGTIAEKIALEKGITINDALNFVVGSISESYYSLNEK